MISWWLATSQYALCLPCHESLVPQCGDTFLRGPRAIPTHMPLQGGVLHPKTSMLVALLGKWGLDQGQTVLLVVEELTKNLTLASRNLPGVMLTTADRLVLSEILRAEKIVIDAGALAYIQVRITNH